MVAAQKKRPCEHGLDRRFRLVLITTSDSTATDRRSGLLSLLFCGRPDRLCRDVGTLYSPGTAVAPGAGSVLNPAWWHRGHRMLLRSIPPALAGYTLPRRWAGSDCRCPSRRQGESTQECDDRHQIFACVQCKKCKNRQVITKRAEFRQASNRARSCDGAVHRGGCDEKSGDTSRCVAAFFKGYQCLSR